MAAKQPEVLTRLRTKMEDWLNDVNAFIPTHKEQ